jgi:predicted hydrolase (HD superfamily)
MNQEFSRQQAWELLTQWTKGDSLLKHALSVEACVIAYAEEEVLRLGLAGKDAAEKVNLYSMTALLHDFDYEKHPSMEEHPFVGNRILTEQGWPDELKTAILGHAEYSGVPRETHLAKTLFACDELAGFLTACSLVKPTKSIHDVEVNGVKKKLKDKAFARGVNREDIRKGAEELGVDLDRHLQFCLSAMQRRAVILGLDGVSASSTETQVGRT